MRGFLSLEPDEATRLRLAAVQNRLRDALARQGVSFPERLGVTLLAWPFGTQDEIEAAAALVEPPQGEFALQSLHGRPGDDRPAEVGLVVAGLETWQREAFERLKGPLDPDPSKEAFVRLARVAPASRKVGIALRGSGLIGQSYGVFVPDALTFWRQTPQGFEVCRTMPLV